MHLITTRTIPEAHRQVIDLIMNLPEDQVTEDGETVKQLDEPVTIHITYPEPMVIPGSRFGEKFQAEYVKKVCEITPRRNDGLDADTMMLEIIKMLTEKFPQYKWYDEGLLCRQILSDRLRKRK